MSALLPQATDNDSASAAYRIVEWLDLHDLDAEMLQDVIAAYHSGALADQPFFLSEMEQTESDGLDLADQRTCYFRFVLQALSSSFERIGNIRAILETISFQTFPHSGMNVPYTIDTGEGRPPVIVMNWRGRPDDLICLAHEAAHALQITLSNHMVMPPLARETCAFLGELFLIEDARKHNPTLYPLLQQVWQAENEVYLTNDLDSLSDALTDVSTPYNYRQNYPIARLVAVELFSRGNGIWLQDLFASGCKGMMHLPVMAMADLAGEIKNYLPHMPRNDPEHPAVNAYRGLGAMVLLDIDYWEGESEKQIKDYYANLLEHLRKKTAFVALNAGRRPVGYATWDEPRGDEIVTLTRQAAPFGDHLLLQRTLEHRLNHADSAAAYHFRSARAEQVAW